MSQPSPALHHAVQVLPQGLQGDLCLPSTPRGLVIFAHGSGSSRLSPRNIVVARALNEHGFATLLFDLLTRQEESDRNNVFDIDLLSERLIGAIDWIKAQPVTNALPLGLFGASTGAAAALGMRERAGRGVAGPPPLGGTTGPGGGGAHPFHISTHRGLRVGAAGGSDAKTRGPAVPRPAGTVCHDRVVRIIVAVS